jgi:hypothetical protein
MCPNGILAVGCIPIGSVVILVMGHYYKFIDKKKIARPKWFSHIPTKKQIKLWS